jgi:hypothetical protein
MTDPSTPPIDLQSYVDQAAAAIGLSIAPQDMPAVVAYLPIWRASRRR